jgi:hypothetical protein
MLNLVTNPYEAVIGENACRMLVTSGSALLDVANNSTITEPLSLLEHTFCWQHMAPTAPDTLSRCIRAYPRTHAQTHGQQKSIRSSYTTRRTFMWLAINRNYSRRYVCVSQAYCRGQVVESTSGDRRTLLLTLPAFSTTRLAAVVNTRTLDVQVIDCNQMANA